MVDNHNIKSCKDCATITIILIAKTSVRFNELLRLCRDRIDKKYSAPRLTRHLKKLEGKFVKRKEIGKQEVVYTLFIPKSDSQLDKLDLNFKVERLRELTLKQLVTKALKLHRLLALQEQIIIFEKKLNIGNSQDLANKLHITRVVLRDKYKQYQAAMDNRDSSEYQQELVNLKNEFNDLISNTIPE